MASFIRSWMLVRLAVLIFIVSLESRWSTEGCLEQERFALLQLKPFFNSLHYLDNWVEGDHNNSDCCQWDRVGCNDTTGRVILLNLYQTRDEEMGEWYLNASLFSPFQHLQMLDLFFNQIAGCVENEGWRLSNLEYLDLNSNIFNNNNLSSLSALTSLKTLYLEDVGLEGSIDLPEIFDSLSKLEELDLSNNHINKLVVMKDNGSVGLRNLQYISLSNVSIHDGSALLRSLGSLPYLKRLDLSFNNFSGNIMSTRELHNFTNLEELYMQSASFHASLLQSIAAFTSLETLHMDDCQLNGSIGTKGTRSGLEPEMETMEIKKGTRLGKAGLVWRRWNQKGYQIWFGTKKGTRLGEGWSPHHRCQMETKIHLRWSPIFAPNGVVASPSTPR